MLDIRDLEKWFKERPKWLQDAARRITQKKELAREDYEELAELCIKEAIGSDFQYSGLPDGALDLTDTTASLRIDEIADVKGINALSCTKPMCFGDNPINVVYGRNGSGKSGYIRVLKHMCSVRRPGPLHGNVFKTKSAEKSAKITYTKGDKRTTVDWNGHPLADLAGIEIYDNACGLAYINDENEASAEPCLLRFFSDLTAVCTTINELIEHKCKLLASKLPTLPPEHANTSAGQWYTKLRSDTNPTEIGSKWSWNADKEKEQADLGRRLAEGNPADKARTLRRQSVNLLSVKSTLEACHAGLGPNQFTAFLAQKQDAKTKKKAAEDDAHKVFGNAPLEGVGTESWRLLWMAARDYSTKHAYKDKPYPVTYSDARCVLCQSTMDTETKRRIESFEAFVNSQLRQQADDAQILLNEKTKALPTVPTTNELELKLQAGGQDSTDLCMQIEAFRSDLHKCYGSFLVAESIDSLSLLPNEEVLKEIQKAADELENQATLLDEDAKGLNREALLQQSKELAARKWLNQQSDAIKAEIARLKTLADYQNARDLTSTQALSRRKSVLAEALITQAYVDRFQKELSGFGANNIRVEIKKTHTQVGKVFHRLVLSHANANVKADEVLSEGELRIVSLSAFLADTEGRDSRTTFIFDDPISSLDHVYEETTARRLVELASKRQVIVFTHRLSLVGYIQKYSEKKGISNEILALSQYIPGELTDVPIDVKRTDKAINTLLNDKIAALRKAYNTDEAQYEALAKALCRDTRVLLERVVESDLIKEVVRRFSPEVQTKGKLQKLALISEEDCTFIDEFITKFSRYEHSQPDEAPIPIPPPDDIEKDLAAIKTFIIELRKR